jgi:hypothetical protein
MTTKRILGLPFAGFYGSHHDAELDQVAEQMFQNNQGDTNYGLIDRLMRSCSWKVVHSAYAAEYVAGLLAELGIEGTFCEMISPREYNFETDRVFAEIELSQVLRVIDGTQPETLDRIAAERHTSRSGFISFYSPDWRSWGEIESWDCNQLQTLVEAYMVDITGSFDELDVMEHARCNGVMETWIADNTRDIERLYKIAEYLHRREGRHEFG